MKSFTFILIAVFSSTAIFAQSAFSGQITDQESIEALIGANVVAYQNDKYVAGVTTDVDGLYRISLKPGKYDIQVTYIGYPAKILEEVRIEPDSETTMDIELLAGIELEEVVVTAYGHPITKQCYWICGTTVKSEALPEIPKPEKAIPQLDTQIFQIYPNPTVNHVFIQINEAADQLNLISVTGRTLKTIMQVQSGTLQLDLSPFPAGTYFVQIQNGAELITKRLIISNQ